MEAVMNTKKAKKLAATKGSEEEKELFGSGEPYILTLRIPTEVNEALDRYIAKNTTLQRQKKKTIIFALRRFLEEKGEL